MNGSNQRPVLAGFHVGRSEVDLHFPNGLAELSIIAIELGQLARGDWPLEA
jgi:hypothetical protein